MHKLVFVLTCFVAFSNSETPDIYWSMNDGNYSVINPDIGDHLYYLNISKENIADGEGLSGNALKLDEGDVSVAGGESINFELLKGNCFVNLSLCQEGLSAAMWLKVNRPTTKSFCIFTTQTTCKPIEGRSIPEQLLQGVSILTDNLGNLVIIVVSNNLYFAKLSLESINLTVWNHIGFTLSFQSGIKVFINGSDANADSYNLVQDSSRFDGAYMAFGDKSNSVAILIDDAKLWYKYISDEEFFKNYFQTTYTASHTTITSPHTTKATTAVSKTTAKSIGGLTSSQVTSGSFSTQSSIGNGGTVDGLIGNASTIAVENSTVDQPAGRIWHWILIAFCFLILFILAFMILLLCKRRRQTRNERGFHSVEMSSAATSNSYFSSRQDTNGGSTTAELL